MGEQGASGIIVLIVARETDVSLDGNGDARLPDAYTQRNPATSPKHNGSTARNVSARQ